MNAKDRLAFLKATKQCSWRTIEGLLNQLDVAQDTYLAHLKRIAELEKDTEQLAGLLHQAIICHEGKGEDTIDISWIADFNRYLLKEHRKRRRDVLLDHTPEYTKNYTDDGGQTKPIPPGNYNLKVVDVVTKGRGKKKRLVTTYRTA